MNPIPYGCQNITQDDIDEVIRVLRSDYLTQGPEIRKFEARFAAYVGARHAVAVSNGTAALHLCTLALSVDGGDKVITTPITFAASANCVRFCEGQVVFSDIDPKSYCLDPGRVEELLSNAPAGTYKGIIPVDFAGYPADMAEFRRLADRYGLWIVEDACHAPGGFFTTPDGKRQNCGNGKFADLSVFSFHPVKHITSGEGGMVTTDSDALYDRLLRLRTHGITKDGAAFRNSANLALGGGADGQAGYPGWYYEMQDLGFNYRITDFQAALGSSQLRRADAGLARRRQIAAAYCEAFRDKPFIKGQSGVVEGHAYHLYVIEVEDRIGLYTHLRENGILAQIHYVPLHLMPYYRQFGWKAGDMPAAETYYSRCLSLPMFPTLTPSDQDRVIRSVLSFYE